MPLVTHRAIGAHDTSAKAMIHLIRFIFHLLGSTVKFPQLGALRAKGQWRASELSTATAVHPFTLCCRTCDFSLTAWSGVMRLNSPRLRTSAGLWPPGSSRHADLYAQAQKRHWILEIHFVDSIRQLADSTKIS